MALFAMYVEAVSVLPQLRTLQNAEVYICFLLHYELSFGLCLSLNKTNKISSNIRLYEFYWYTVIDILGDQLHQILSLIVWKARKSFIMDTNIVLCCVP